MPTILVNELIARIDYKQSIFPVPPLDPRAYRFREFKFLTGGSAEQNTLKIGQIVTAEVNGQVRPLQAGTSASYTNAQLKLMEIGIVTSLFTSYSDRVERRGSSIDEMVFAADGGGIEYAVIKNVEIYLDQIKLLTNTAGTYTFEDIVIATHLGSGGLLQGLLGVRDIHSNDRQTVALIN